MTRGIVRRRLHSLPRMGRITARCNVRQEIRTPDRVERMPVWTCLARYARGKTATRRCNQVRLRRDIECTD